MERDRGTQPGSCGDIRLSGSGLQISGARGCDWGHPVPDSYAEPATCAANITQLHPAWPGLCCAPRLPGPQCTLGAQTRGKKQSVWPESGPGRLVGSTLPQCSAGPGHSALHTSQPGQARGNSHDSVTHTVLKCFIYLHLNYNISLFLLHK